MQFIIAKSASVAAAQLREMGAAPVDGKGRCLHIRGVAVRIVDTGRGGVLNGRGPGTLVYLGYQFWNRPDWDQLREIIRARKYETLEL
jgi:hypothetical protein